MCKSLDEMLNFARKVVNYGIVDIRNVKLSKFLCLTHFMHVVVLDLIDDLSFVFDILFVVALENIALPVRHCFPVQLFFFLFLL